MGDGDSEKPASWVDIDVTKAVVSEEQKPGADIIPSPGTHVDCVFEFEP